MVSGDIFLVLIIITIAIIVIIIVFLLSSRQPEILFNNDFVNITEMFGMEIKREEIVSVVMTDTSLPSMYKSWGLSFFGINKGFFVIYENNKICKLYTQTDKPPFIIVTLKNNLQIFINFKNKELMEKYYQEFLNYGNTSENKN